MPLFRKSNLTESTSLGIWKITEPPEILKSGICLSPDEIKYYLSMHSELRKKQWLSYRNILKTLMNKDDPDLYYDENGKPHTGSSNHHLSVSHTGLISAAIVSTDGRVGIDVEMIKERIERVKERFLSHEELDHIGTTGRIEKLTIYWGAKESLFKLHGKPDLDFRNDIIIEPFSFDHSVLSGMLYGILKTEERIIRFPVYYERIEDFIIVYTTESSGR